MRFNKIYLEITNVCNLNCSFCHGTLRAPAMLSSSQFDELTDKIRNYTPYLYYHLMGEPLLHPELPDFLSMAKDKGFKSVLTTNGTLLERCADRLLDSNALYKVNISLQAFEGNNMESLEDYVSGCTEFTKWASAGGVLSVFRLWNINGAGSLNEKIMQRLKSAFPGEWTEAGNGFRLGERVYLDFAKVFDWPDMDAEVISDSCYCYGLKDQLGILCDGTVVPCCLDSDGIIRLGNLFENSMEDILASEQVLKMIEGFRRRRPSEELCRKCGYARRFDK